MATDVKVLIDKGRGGSASMGTALFLGDSDDPEQILKRADFAMFAAKRIGCKSPLNGCFPRLASSAEGRVKAASFWSPDSRGEFVASPG